MHKDTAGIITGLLKELGEGSPEARSQLWSVVYDQLRTMAQRYLRQEREGHTLQPTALVHEAYLRLADLSQIKWQDRCHFFAIAAKVMRQILVDHARRRARIKRGGDQLTLQLDEAGDVAVGCGAELVALDDALTALETIDSERAAVVELRFFGGLATKEIAEVLHCSERTVKRKWIVAKTWLYQQLQGAERA